MIDEVACVNQTTIPVSVLDYGIVSGVAVSRRIAPEVRFLRGDCNTDGAVDVADAVFALDSLFVGEGAPGCDDACDSNDDGTVNIADAVATLGVLFLGNGAIPAPGIETCGVDPTDDGLGCATPAGACQ